MISRALICGSSSILRQLAFRNYQLARNFSIGLNPRARSQMALARVSAALPTAMSYSDKHSIPELDYPEVKDLITRTDRYLIDLRNPEDVEKNGRIPTSLNIPWSSLKQEMKLHPRKFLRKYGRQKPHRDSYIALHCHTGKRSLEGAELLEAMGYNRVYNYAGSWKDWAKHEGIKN